MFGLCWLDDPGRQILPTYAHGTFLNVDYKAHFDYKKKAEKQTEKRSVSISVCFRFVKEPDRNRRLLGVKKHHFRLALHDAHGVSAAR